MVCYAFEVLLCLGVLPVGNRSLYRGAYSTYAYVKKLFDAVLVLGGVIEKSWRIGAVSRKKIDHFRY